MSEDAAAAQPSGAAGKAASGQRAAANPFDVLPANLFNVFTTQGNGSLQRHYMAILLRIYTLAEFNRFGLTREVVVGEIVDYLKAVDPEELAAIGTEEGADGGERDYAGYLLRRLVDTGWLEREQSADYTEFIVLPDYAFTLLEALRAIQEQKPKEFTGQLYAAHQLLTAEGDDFSPALALTQAYENVRQVVRGLNELNQNIRRYTERATRDPATGERVSVPELLRLQYEDYAQALGPAYHALKTSDHVSRYRRDIVIRLQGWQMDDEWLNRTADELAVQGRRTPGQAAEEVGHIMRFVVQQLEGLDPLLEEIDRRHAGYLRTSLRQVRYQLVNAEGSLRERLVVLGQQLAALMEEGEAWLLDEMPSLRAPGVHAPDVASFYTPPRRRAPFTPEPVVMPLLDPDDAEALRALTLEEISQALTPDKVDGYVQSLFNGHRRIHVRDLPQELLADLPWLIYVIAYGNHPDTRYGLEPLPGEPMRLGACRVKPFELVKEGFDPGIRAKAPPANGRPRRL
ncbi:MAG TPA: Wadjet anti-phage system protein JetA family protein [Anaerolineae bacterium]|nr:Wadjet anti-phage system protein JetA family protein [Anaerolineae bacterium]